MNQMNDDEIHDICEKIMNAEIEYDERKELYDFLNLKKAGVSVLKQTDERYKRYLDGITIWEIDGISFEYIRDNIKSYLELETTKENLVIKIKLMRKIDKQLKEVLEKN